MLGGWWPRHHIWWWSRAVIWWLLWTLTGRETLLYQNMDGIFLDPLLHFWIHLKVPRWRPCRAGNNPCYLWYSKAYIIFTQVTGYRYVKTLMPQWQESKYDRYHVTNNKIEFIYICIDMYRWNKFEVYGVKVGLGCFEVFTSF